MDTKLLPITLIALCGMAPPSHAQVLANTTTYYVSNAGNDAANGTSPATAWRTLAKVSTFDATAGFLPGDSILLERGGIWNEPLTLTSTGTDAARITLSHYGAIVQPPVVSRRNAGAGAKCLELSGSHWVVRGLLFEHAHRGIYCQSATGRDVEINGCTFRDMDDRTAFTNISTGIMLAGVGWQDVTVRYCQFERVSCGFYNETGTNSTNLLIDRCEAFGGWAAGFAFMNVSNSTISNSRVHDVGGLNAVGSTACYLNSCTNVIVTHCSFSKCKHGGGPDGCGIDFESNNTNCVLANSMIFDNEGPAVLMLSGGGSPNNGIIIANNLFYNNNTVLHSYPGNSDPDTTMFLAGTPASTGTISHCGIYRNGTAAFGGDWSGFSQTGTLVGTQCRGWTPMYGQFTNLSLGGNGHIVAVQNGTVHRWSGSTTGNSWIPVSGLSNVVRASIGDDGELWATDTSDRPWRFTGGSTWTTSAAWPSLTRVTAGSAANIWGINSAGAVFRWSAGAWQTQAGAPLLSDIEAGPVAGDVYGLRGSNVHRRAAGTWSTVANLTLTQISLHTMNVPISGPPTQFGDIVAGVNGTTIKRSVNGAVASSWQTLPGSLVQVSEGSDGRLWGLDASGFVWHYQ